MPITTLSTLNDVLRALTALQVRSRDSATLTIEPETICMPVGQWCSAVMSKYKSSYVIKRPDFNDYLEVLRIRPWDHNEGKAMPCGVSLHCWVIGSSCLCALCLSCLTRSAFFAE